MKNTTVLLAGATGLIGSTALQVMLGDPRITRVIALVRKPLSTAHPKLEQWVATGDLLTGLRDERVDGVVCALGTTIRNVGGDQRKFIHVDKDLVVGIGRWAKAHGASGFSVISAVGADASSRVFYNRVKGEMERELEATGIPALHIFHPSILTGPRQEKRMGERIGIVVMRAVAPLLPHRYRPMPHDVLAQAAVNSAILGEPGVHRHTYDAILRLAGRH
jgi:uncharacterized protein YbjT (DUF2867 family)